VSDPEIEYLSVADLLEIASGLMPQLEVRDPGLPAAAAVRDSGLLPRQRARSDLHGR